MLYNLSTNAMFHIIKDCGGNVTEKQVLEAFTLLTSDDQV